MNRRWVGFVGAGLATLMLGGVFGTVVPGLGAITFIAGTVLVLAGAISAGRLRRDPYDLNDLRRLDEQEELRAIQEPDLDANPEEVLCPHCGTVYRTRLPVCPNCKRAG